MEDGKPPSHSGCVKSADFRSMMANLTRQQEYLLGRIPKLWDATDLDEKEPAEVLKARKVISAYEERQSRLRKSRKDRLTRAVNAAREAIYFKPAEDALAIIKILESEFS